MKGSNAVEAGVRGARRASSWCSTAMYTSVLSIATFFVPFFDLLSLTAALVAVVAGPIGLVMLARARRSLPRWADVETPAERVAFKRAARAHRQGWVGSGIGFLTLGLQVMALV